MTSQTSSIQKINLPLIKAKFNSKCCISGQHISAGDLVFYRPETKQVFKAVKVYKNDLSADLRVSSYFFKQVELYFNEWLSDQRGDQYDMYTMGLEEYNGGTYLHAKGAIQQAVEEIHNLMDEESVNWCWLYSPAVLDAMDCSFQY